MARGRAVAHRGERTITARSRNLPVIVRCHLCPDVDGRIVTTAGRAWTVAMDHALDEHRAALLADPDATCAAFTVSTDGEPRPLATIRGDR